MTPPSPTHIGRYRIEREVGRGGMGVVYEAVDTLLGRTVALKTFAVKPTTAEREREAFERRFLDEARIAATLEHPNVVSVHDLGRDADSGLLFMALEFVRGETLAEGLGRGPMPWPDGCRLIAKVARALHTAHEKKIVHRDIKPANIMVTASGEPKIMDFGIAKGSESHLTLVGQIFGTPAYMSPEQGAGEVVDARSDIFSLGSVLYELVTNAQAFLGETSGETLKKVLHDEPRPASARTGVPKALDDIISKALRKARDERYQSAVEFADDLDGLVEDSTALVPPSPGLQETQPLVRTPPADTTPEIPDRSPATVTIAPPATAAERGASPTRSRNLLAMGSIAILVLAAGAWLFLGGRAGRESRHDARARMAELEATSSATALSRDQEIEAWAKLARQAAAERDAATASAALQHLRAGYPGDQRVLQLARDLNESFSAAALAAETEMLHAQALAEEDAGSAALPALVEADTLAASAGQSMANGDFTTATRGFVAATAAYDRVRRSLLGAALGSGAEDGSVGRDASGDGADGGGPPAPTPEGSPLP